MLMATLFGLYPFLLKLYADGGYQGPEFRKAMKTILSQVDVEIVKRSDQAKGFVVLPKRWVVERTLAWLNRCRRLAKDWESLNHKARAFLLLASIRLMVRRLCRICVRFPDRLLRDRAGDPPTAPPIWNHLYSMRSPAHGWPTIPVMGCGPAPRARGSV